MVPPLSLNIVSLIENNPITRLSQTYQHKLLTKIKANFTDHQQQMFVASFYCYLNHDTRNDFVIDLDAIWQWLGFQSKYNTKRLLEKYFTLDKDYKLLLRHTAEQKEDTRGGHNREIIKLNVETFKKLCLKADTTKADEIHDYYLKLEEILHEVLQEESDELKLQLEQKNTQLQEQIITAERDKEILKEKTLIELFPQNTQCVYYGRIDNLSGKQEPLIKFGNSNNLKQRVKQHRDTYHNFRLINAFKVENKLQIENAIKNHPLFIARLRTLYLCSKNYIELLSINGLTFPELDNIFRGIITTIEYSHENYMKMLVQNNALKEELKIQKEANHFNESVLLKTTIERLTLENSKLIKKYNTLARRTPASLATPAAADAPLLKTIPLQTDQIIAAFKKNMRNKQGTYIIDGQEYKKNEGTRQEVWDGIAYQTSGCLLKPNLTLNKYGKLVSKDKSIASMYNNHLDDYNSTR
jgi:hypothetical protein